MTERPEHERAAAGSEEPKVQDTEPSDVDGGINVSIAVEVAWCDDCGAYAEMGAENCPGCGAVVDVDWEEKAHLYRARREVFGDLAEALEDPPGSAAAVPLSERQYLRFINGSHILSAEPSTRMSRIVNGLDLSEPSTIRGAETREAARVLRRDALKLRTLIAELRSLKPYGVFAEPHGHLVRAFEAYRQHFRELAGALLAKGPSEVEERKKAAQPPIDLASSELRAFGMVFDELSEAYPGGLADDTVEERLASFLIGTVDGEVEDLTDLSQLGLGSFDAFMAPRDDGYRYFSGMLATPLEDLAEGMPQVLYLLALMVGSQEDPAGILHRASMFVEVVNDAMAEDRAAMLGAAVDAQKDLKRPRASCLPWSPRWRRCSRRRV